MDETKDMFIDGPADLSEVYAKNSQYKPYLDKVLKGIKESGTGGLKQRFIAADTDQLKKKLSTLRAQCIYLGGEYARIVFIASNNDNLPVKDEAGNNQFRVYSVLNDKAIEPAAKAKKKGVKKGVKTADGQAQKGRGRKSKLAPATTVVQPIIPEQAEAMAEAADKNLLISVNSGMMPAEVMSKMLANSQEAAARIQEELKTQGLIEERKASLNKQLQSKQEIIEALKKKLEQ
jgi:hypothetical protein